ncbi:MAG: 4-hydroxy-tetrahydrodipicolinate reductase [SAR86 cluster bacterium]|uniref:4-hydroxy-tetrahydrodipicolinate reductase n=1 Tax=SAR86 cluster bacterium TaxID=2030880 RepID=A0A937JAH8_9GAMM|nr:4-hydroxy-tetrahydrodipicolinate reductase [SAR86 cluster bacterium]
MTGIYINGVSGKMGTNLLKLCANDKNIKICDDLNDDSLEVIIDFSHPDSTLKLLKSLPTQKISLIIGTTGLKEEHFQYIEEISKDKRILIAPNLSKGISVFKNTIVEFIKTNDKELHCLIEETHHDQKIDSPSGTAIELKKIIESNNTKNLIADIEIISKRTGKIFGIHEIIFYKDTKKIQFKHESKSRNIYSDGALQAAHWIKDKEEGLYSFEDFLKS